MTKRVAGIMMAITTKRVFSLPSRNSGTTKLVMAMNANIYAHIRAARRHEHALGRQVAGRRSTGTHRYEHDGGGPQPVALLHQPTPVTGQQLRPLRGQHVAWCSRRGTQRGGCILSAARSFSLVLTWRWAQLPQLARRHLARLGGRRMAEARENHRRHRKPASEEPLRSKNTRCVSGAPAQRAKHQAGAPHRSQALPRDIKSMDIVPSAPTT
jgi:hypothetical protein